MSCNYCELTLNTEYNWTNINIMCSDCGNTVHWNSKLIRYKYKNKGQHYFDILETYNCAECGMNVNEAIIPCGGSYYFNTDDVSESLLIPQEFIIKK